MALPERDERGRFKKGVSGNRKGAPKKGESMRAILERVSQEMTQINSSGKPETVTRKEALARVLWQNLFVERKRGKRTVVEVNPTIAKLVLDRMEGLPVATHEIGAINKEPIPINIILPENADYPDDTEDA